MCGWQIKQFIEIVFADVPSLPHLWPLLTPAPNKKMSEARKTLTQTNNQNLDIFP